MPSNAAVEAALLQHGATHAEVEAAMHDGGDAIHKLARRTGCDLSDTAALDAALADAKARAKAAHKEASMRKVAKLSDDELRRLRLAFDNFDKDGSGQLDKEEFRKAMIDSGFMPYHYEVEELFKDADDDSSGLVDFDEYCTFVQLYKSKQPWLERWMESIMHAVLPSPPYMQDSPKPDTLAGPGTLI